MSGPLTGYRIVEFEGIGPAPYCGLLLSDLGADVVRIARPDVDRGPLIADIGRDVIDRGRSLIELDLKSGEGAAHALRLVDRADAVVEGLRPGVMERLGLGPEVCLERNPSLVFCRITGWGQTGPMAHQAGHDLNYIALSGALAAMGEPGCPPVPPLNLVGDYGGGGLYAAFGILAALLHAQKTGQGQIVDSAMVDGAASQMAMIYGLFGSGHWSLDRGQNLLDGSAPFYRCYTCSDGRYIAIGSIEPAFFAKMMTGLGLQPEAWNQADKATWPAMTEAIASSVRCFPRDHWAEVFEGTDACVSPVLTMGEAAEHPHNHARNTFAADPVQPSPGPRFSRTPGFIRPITQTNVEAVLDQWTAR